MRAAEARAKREHRQLLADVDSENERRYREAHAAHSAVVDAARKVLYTAFGMLAMCGICVSV